MAGAGFIDDFTEIRVAAYDTLLQHIITPQAIWTDANAVVLANTLGTGLSSLRDGWGGLDMPEIQISRTPLSSGKGTRLAQRALLARTLTMPVLSRTAHKDALPPLIQLCASASPLVVGFRYPTQSDSRYLIMGNYEDGIDRSRRGQRPVSSIMPVFSSDSPYLISPQIHPAGSTATFATTGAEDIIWGVFFTALTGTALSISVGSDVLSVGLSSRPVRFLFVSGGPWYGFTAYTAAPPTGQPDYTIRRLTDTGSVPEYLQPNRAYTISITGGTGQIFWLKNHESA